MKDPYIGHSPIVSGEIAEDITYYYAVSEQIPTVCGLGVLVNTDLTVLAAGGYLVQLLPGAGEDTIDRLEENINGMKSVTQMLTDGLSPQDIAFLALKGFDPQVLDETTVEYRCNCSRDRMERALISLGREELLRLAQEQEDTEMVCHFCGQKHHFSSRELRALAGEKE